VKNFLGVIHPYKLKGIWERERLLLGYANPHCNERENFLFANSKQQKPRESFGNCYNSHQINRQTRVFRYWRWTYCTTLCENSRYIVKINVATLNPKPSLFFLKNISSVCMANCTLVKFQEPTPFILILRCNCVQSDQHKVAPCSLAKQSAFRFLKKTLHLGYLSSFHILRMCNWVCLFLKFCMGILEVLPDVFKREIFMVFKLEYVWDESAPYSRHTYSLLV